MSNSLDLDAEQSKNFFDALPFDQAIEIYIEYLKAASNGNIKKTDQLFEQYPDLFQPDTLARAKEALGHVAKITKNTWLVELLEQTRKLV